MCYTRNASYLVSKVNFIHSPIVLELRMLCVTSDNIALLTSNCNINSPRLYFNNNKTLLNFIRRSTSNHMMCQALGKNIILSMLSLHSLSSSLIYLISHPSLHSLSCSLSCFFPFPFVSLNYFRSFSKISHCVLCKPQYLILILFLYTQQTQINKTT